MDRDNYKCTNVTLSEEFSVKLQEDLQKLIKKQGYLTFTAGVKKVSTGGNNFLGELYEVNVVGQTNDGDKETNIFLKHIIYNDDFKAYSIPEVYAKEAFIYKDFGKVIVELQQDANIPLENRFKLVECFDETNGEVIILENVTKKGFKTMFRMDVMSIEFAKLAIEQLARFHGLSFVLQRRRPDYFEANIKTIKQSFVYDEYWTEFIKNTCEVSVKRLDEDTKRKVSKFLDIAAEKYPKYMTGTDLPIKCLVHGDYKMNNVLLKETDGVVTEVIPIDYQQVYYGCPIIDLIYFIYATSDRNFRKQHLNTLKDLYFDTLTTYLDCFDIDVTDFFSRQDFDECFHNSLDYALMYTLYMLPMFFISDEDIPDFSKDELTELTIKVDERFYERMQGIIDDFVELGVI